MRDVLRYATIISGVQCVQIMDGIMLTLMLFVINLDSQNSVSHFIALWLLIADCTIFPQMPMLLSRPSLVLEWALFFWIM